MKLNNKLEISLSVGNFTLEPLSEARPWLAIPLLVGRIYFVWKSINQSVNRIVISNLSVKVLVSITKSFIKTKGCYIFLRVITQTKDFQFHRHLSQTVYLSVCMYVRLSVCLFVCICLWISRVIDSCRYALSSCYLPHWLKKM